MNSHFLSLYRILFSIRIINRIFIEPIRLFKGADTTMSEKNVLVQKPHFIEQSEIFKLFFGRP